MAVSGIDPQPMSKDNSWYKYYSFLPKVECVDDGNMIQSNAKEYKANPFGLYSIAWEYSGMDKIGLPALSL